VQAERKSTVSIYLLCRVLMEIFAQSTLADVTPDLADRLEDIIYKQLSAADPEYLDESPLRQSNWVIFGQLLGAMSDMDFENVSRRFIEDLEKMQLHLGSRRDTEGRAVLVIRGMRWLRVKYSTDSAWDRFCDFMQLLGRIAANASGQAIKYEFNILFEQLLLPLAAGATSQLNSAKWRTSIELIKPRLIQMLAKPKHWQNVFPTLAVVLCASPQESFAAQWLSLILPLPTKLKERHTRPAALRAICRLVWTYLYRVSDVPSATSKNLSDIIRLVFIPGKKSYVTTEPAIAEPLIQLIRIIGFKYQDLCFRTIIFPLLNSDLFTSGREIRIADLEPEKIVIGIRSFLATTTDLEKGEAPPFPTNFEGNQGSEPFQVVPNPLSPRPMIESMTKSSVVKEERLSRPVMTATFSDITRDAYTRFCKILGEITLFCDNAFGGQAVLDEKFSQTPKTPMAEAFSFSRRDDHLAATESRQGFYDLLHVAVQALPRCLSPHISFKSLINLLCTGTAHVRSNIAASSAQSLKAIARQSHAQQVTIGFARFIFNFDDRYATMSDGGMLGPAHIESTLSLYVELLEIWIEEIKQKTKRMADPTEETLTGLRSVQLDLSTLQPHVDEVESHGLFFLCSPSRRVRAFAVTVLRLVTEFDAALVQETTRVIRILEGSPQVVMDVNDEKLTVVERSRLQRGMRKSNIQSTLVELCSSDTQYDSTLWFKIFPNLIRISFELCPFATTLTREMICARISQMQKTVSAQAEGYRTSPYPSIDTAAARGGPRILTTSPEVVIEQWKLYLIFACTTLTNVGAQQHAQGQNAQHTRKSSKSSQQSGDKILSAGELFARVIPFLAVSNVAVRDAVVAGLGSINHNLYRTLLESLHPAVTNCNDEAKARIANHQRTTSSSRPRSRRTDYLRTEIAHVYKLTSHFLKKPEVYNDEWILINLVNYTKELRLFLNDAEIQTEWEFTKLRTHYCGLTEALYEGIAKSKDPIRWMSFQARKAAFALMEDWCGYSPNQPQIRQREDTMRRSMLDREQELNKGIVTAAMEIEKRDLRTAALSAMATLCGGPISITTDSKVHLQFDVLRMLSWIDTIFDTPSDKNHNIGRRALKNLIVHNKEHDYFLRRSIDMCYMAKSPKALESYFEVVNDVLTETEDFAQPFWKVLCACLFTLGNENNQLRTKSAKLLRMVEGRQLQTSSKLEELDISISDKTIAVYKRAQFDMSQRLAQYHPELAFLVFSEFSRVFKDLQADPQRQMVAAMLPWVQTIELQLDPNGGPTATSYMLLVNLFEITVRCGNHLHNEIQALWQALATGPHGGNVQLVLDFMITLCLDKKEQDFVNYAKQIVVYLSGTPAGSKVIEFLLLQITPKAMVQDKDKRQSFTVPPEATALPYLADLALVLPGGAKQQGFSLGQLSLILLVDLMVAPMQLSQENVPMLLQVILILWDHYIPVVQDHAREMLVHLIHELVNSQIEDQTTDPTKREIEDFIESIRRNELKVVWAYDDYNGKRDEESDLRVPDGMVYVATHVVKIFSIVLPDIREEWGRMALKWASNCPVHHLACRSFQLFRSILTSLDQPMLADMLARLSNTVADEGSEVQTFSMEILTTLKTIIDALAADDLIQYPQLFWTTCACLDTIHEREFMESIAMLEKLIDKLDLSDPATLQRLSDSFPPKWEGHFEGLQCLIYKGVRSSACLDRSLRLIERLTVLPSSLLVGDDSRLLFTIMANFPRYLRWFEHKEVTDPAVLVSADKLAKVAELQGLAAIAKTLQAFADSRYRTDMDFISSALPAIRASFFPDLEFRCLVFLMSLLTNKLPWFKIKTMQLLCMLIPDIDMRKPEISSKGPDLITPLLRLLQTEFCPQALAVLDNVMTMTATPMDNKHLRMSMAGANTSRAFRKEYDRVQSLYGIPEDSGWAIPMPAVHSSTTRANVHAAFYTCAIPEMMVAVEDATPKIELVAEEYTGSYFPDYRTATMMSDDTRGEGHMGDLVMKLESLDDFFDDDDGPESASSAGPPTGASRLTGSTTVDNRENLYDQQTFPILHKSLTRNASVSSFQNGFADMKMSPSREAMVMTPTLFAAENAIPLQPIQQTVRPPLHARSVTSPAFHQVTPPDTAFSFALDEAAVSDDPMMMSDDETLTSSTGRPSTSERVPVLTSTSTEKLSFLDNVTRQGQGFRSGFRSGIRRLTGGAGDREAARTREAIRKELLKSPKVPKVPDVYLQNPKSSEI
jgi:Cell morphogenesis N-terminal/Cell morphogenesis C-terminal/Cell morphogenesis central region